MQLFLVFGQMRNQTSLLRLGEYTNVRTVTLLVSYKHVTVRMYSAAENATIMHWVRLSTSR